MAITGKIDRSASRELTPAQMNEMLANDLDTELPARTQRNIISDKETKKDYHVMLTPSLRARGGDAASSIGDSFSGLMESLLEEYLRNHNLY